MRDRALTGSASGGAEREGKMAASLINFNAGELSPLLRCRCDIEKYASGASRMENFEVLPQGGMRNRAGTEFISEVKDSGKRVRLIPFVFSVEQCYMLEFGDGYVRVWNRETLEQSAEVTVPYACGTLRKLRYVQSADVLYLVHPDYAPARLCRYGETDWRYEEITFTGGPFQEENASGITVTASGKTGEVTLTATEAIFDVPAGGQLFRVTHPNRKSLFEHTFESKKKPDGSCATTESEPFPVKGSWKLTSTGGWYGTVKLKRSFDGGATWADYRSWSSDQSTNISSEGEEAREDVLYKFYMENWREPNDGVIYRCYLNLLVEKYWIHGIVKLNATDGKTATATGTVIDEIGEVTATADWSEGAWDAKNGYPSSICFYQDRLVFAGTKAEPQTVWFSKVGDYHNFEAGTDADEAMVFTLRTNEINAISWILPREEIIVGTEGAEGLIHGLDKNEPLSPSNRKYTPKTAYGSGELPALLVQDCVVFLQRGGEHFREFSYDYATDGYLAPDMSILAEHVLQGGAEEECFKPLPFPGLYFIRADGQMAGFTYERLQNVTAWFRVVTDGSFESCAVLPKGGSDELWVSVKRGGKRFIERFFARECEAPEDSVFLDCAKRSATGLEHLEGRTVSAVVDGKVIEHLTVTGGKVNVPEGGKVLVGLPYTSVWESMPLEFMGQSGSSHGMVKKMSKATILYDKSLGGKVGLTDGGLEAIDQRKTYHRMDSSVPLQTGEYEFVLPGGYTREEKLTIVQDRPHPLTVLGIAHNQAVAGDI